MRKLLIKNIAISIIFILLFCVIAPYMSLAEGENPPQANTMRVEFANATIDPLDDTTITFDDGEIQLAVKFLCDAIPQQFIENVNNRAEAQCDVIKDELGRYDIEITNTGKYRNC